MFGVLNNQILLMPNGATKEITERLWIRWWNIGKLMDLAKENNLRQIWIVKNSNFWKDIKKESEFFEACKKIDWLSESEKADLKNDFLECGDWTVPNVAFKNVLTGWRDNYRCQIIIPALGSSSWKLDEIEHPFCLFNTIEIIKDKLGVLPSFPNKTAQLFFAQTHSKPQKLSENNSEFWKPFADKMESEIIWTRKPTKDELNCKYAHAFDKRMMFLSAARGAEMSESGFIERENLNYSDVKNEIGLFETGKLKFTDKNLQSIFGKETQFYSSTLSVLSGFVSSEIKIKRAWTFPNKKRIFEKFSKQLGEAIKATRIGGESEKCANIAFKNLYTQFFGWLGRTDKRDGFGAEMFRPDWRGFIVSGANANLLRNIIEVEKLFKKFPVGIYHDCLIYFSNSENPIFDFHGSPLLDENKFTYEWTVPAQAVFDILDKNGTAMNLDSLGKKYGVKNG